jgi:hypothetical protein
MAAAAKQKKTFDDVPSALIRRFPRGPVDWGAVVAELEAKRAALDKAIASLRVVIASGVLFAAAEDAMPAMADSVGVLHGGEVPIGAFLGKSIPEAAKLCLQIVKKKMTTREIAESLQKGGIETTAKTSFPSIVHSILMRATRSGTGILKLDRSHWGLAEWYPSGMRAAVAGDRRSRKRRGRAHKPPSEPAITNGLAVAKPRERILQVLHNQPGMELSLQELAEHLRMPKRAVNMALINLVHVNAIQKTAGGKYRIAA